MAPPLHPLAHLHERLRDTPRLTAVFVATWCEFSTEYLEHANANEDTIHIDMSDVDDDAWDSVQVEAIPTAVHYVDGKETARAGPDKVDGLSPQRVQELAQRG